jgi:hypothetical protein
MSEIIMLLILWTEYIRAWTLMEGTAFAVCKRGLSARFLVILHASHAHFAVFVVALNTYERR